MKSRLASAAAAFVLVAGLGTASADDAMTGKINNGSAEIAAPPAAKAGDDGANALDDPARNDRETVKSRAANEVDATTALQNAGSNGMSADAPPGASPPTIPSTQSAENAADDRRSLEQLKLQLTDAQKQVIRARLLRDDTSRSPAEDGAAMAQAKVGSVLPSSVTMHDLPAELIAEIPSAKDFKYVRTDKELLLVDPENWMVVGIL